MADFKYNSPYCGSGSLTREQFLFHETKKILLPQTSAVDLGTGGTYEQFQSGILSEC